MNLFRRFINEDDVILYFQSKNILIKYSNCSICERSMTYYPNMRAFRCNKIFNRKYCNTQTSIAIGTIFSCMKISYIQAIFLVYEFSIKTPINQVAFEYQMSEKTVMKWYNKLIIIVSDYMKRSTTKIGGRNCIVEIDECKLVANKYHKGRLLKSQGG